MQSQIQALMSAIGGINELDKKEVAKRLIEKEAYNQVTDPSVS